MAIETLCTLQEAKTRLGVYDDSLDAEIEGYITASSAAILEYCGRQDTAGLSEVKRECLRAATLTLLPVLFDGTGERAPDYSLADGQLPKSVTAFLHRISAKVIA